VLGDDRHLQPRRRICARARPQPRHVPRLVRYRRGRRRGRHVSLGRVVGRWRVLRRFRLHGHQHERLAADQRTAQGPDGMGPPRPDRRRDQQRHLRSRAAGGVSKRDRLAARAADREARRLLLRLLPAAAGVRFSDANRLRRPYERARVRQWQHDAARLPGRRAVLSGRDERHRHRPGDTRRRRRPSRGPSPVRQRRARCRRTVRWCEPGRRDVRRVRRHAHLHRHLPVELRHLHQRYLRRG
jgi:hypothetical protein